MKRILNDNSGAVMSAFLVLLAVVAWSWQQGVKDYTEAVKSNTCAVNELTTKVEKWVMMTGILAKELDYQKAVNDEQWKYIHDHEQRLAKRDYDKN